ncbi:transposase [Chryseobacterium indologenes]|uniref:Transposase n=1 Tax=Chryseobacterium indologenes TaxID=253 RepID=A0A0N0IVW9_CHRID|nr:transposase [Chryseobacterium indologenes]KPE50893.1 transposase [Chryseobacterium indologenes]
MDLKKLNIGLLIKECVEENGMEIQRISRFLNASEDEIIQMYQSAALNTDLLLRWCKLLEYDFFRLYSQHLILYAPQSSVDYVQKKKLPSSLPAFRKNLYTKEIIEFILDKVRNGEMTKSAVVTEYRIPKSTLYKWMNKYNIPEK